ncbi:hypothetical protein KI387_012160, partial [Taxus chinensis]
RSSDGVDHLLEEEPDFDIKDMVFPSLKPVLTVCSQLQELTVDNKNEEQGGIEKECGEQGYETPKSEKNKIPECLVCPPAPRKPRPTAAKRKRQEDFFIVPADLDSVFYEIIRPRKKIHRSTAREPAWMGLGNNLL